MANNFYNLNVSDCKRTGPVVLITQDISFTFPFSYGYLASYLLEFGESVIILMRPTIQEYDCFVQKLIKMNPLLVGMGSLYPELKEIKELIHSLRVKNCHFPIVIGGQMVTPTPEFSLKITDADIGVIGEGEITLLNLVKALREGTDISNIKGLVIRHGNSIVNTGPGEYIKNMSELPNVSLDCMPPEKWLPVGRYYTGVAQAHWRYNDRVIPVHGGRGCPFKCNFCYHHSKARYRNISSMIEEASENLDRFGGNMLYFGDDLVIATPKRARELVIAIRTIIKQPIEYSISCRFDILSRIDDRLLREMRDTGARIMGLGIESGSQRILDIIDKRITVEQIRSGLTRLHKVGILPTVSIMIGQYSETVEDVEASIALVQDTVRENPNINYAFTYTTPFPGSPLYYRLMEEGYFRDAEDFYNHFFSMKGIELSEHYFKIVFNSSAMDAETVQCMYEKILKVYKKEKRLNKPFGVDYVEYIRRILHRFHPHIQKRILKYLSVTHNSGKPQHVERIYQILYDFTQTRLDWLRLRLLKLV